LCQISGQRVSDKASEARGIGSDCWQHVLSRLSAMQIETVQS
jgi:hypothetical protein